ncbi:hypothetical protein FALCPG4_018137 [Fusarium falciforme]
MSFSSPKTGQQATNILPIKQELKFADDSVPTSEHGELPRLFTNHRDPLKLSGALEKFESFDVTPVIGREFVGVDLANLLRAPNSDELIRDLAITIFFRKQDNLTDDLQKELVQRSGEQSGKPATSRLHIHPVNNAARDHAGKDDKISVVSSQQAKKLFSGSYASFGFGAKRQSLKDQWHSDITFEPIPSDYALLRLTQLPETGGGWSSAETHCPQTRKLRPDHLTDTLWASGYELYDRISPTLQRFLDTLTAKYAQPQFNQAAKENNFSIYSAQRGAPENVGEVLEAVHPVVRTNPVTGWKSIFAVGQHVERIHGLSETENRHFLDWFIDFIVENHDLQVRLK